MNHYIFEIGETSTSFRDRDDVSLCIEVPGNDESDAMARLRQHIERRSVDDDQDMVPFVINEDGLQFRFYLNRSIDSVDSESICDVIEEG